MKLVFSKRADKGYQKLPSSIQKKADKQFAYLKLNYRHPSLRSRKMEVDVFEGRIDYYYRFAFTVEGEKIFIIVIGPHDEGLGKK